MKACPVLLNEFPNFQTRHEALFCPSFTAHSSTSNLPFNQLLLISIASRHTRKQGLSGGSSCLCVIRFYCFVTLQDRLLIRFRLHCFSIRPPAALPQHSPSRLHVVPVRAPYLLSRWCRGIRPPAVRQFCTARPGGAPPGAGALGNRFDVLW